MKRFLTILLFLTQPLWVFADHPAPQLKQDWLRQAELRYTTTENGEVSQAVFQAVLTSGRKLVADLKQQGIDVKDATAVFDRVENSSLTESDYFELRHAIRTLALKNPLLDFDSILFAKTYPGRSDSVCGDVVCSKR